MEPERLYEREDTTHGDDVGFDEDAWDHVGHCLINEKDTLCLGNKQRDIFIENIYQYTYLYALPIHIYI